MRSGDRQARVAADRAATAASHRTASVPSPDAHPGDLAVSKHDRHASSDDAGARVHVEAELRSHVRWERHDQSVLFATGHAGGEAAGCVQRKGEERRRVRRRVAQVAVRAAAR